MLSHRVAGPANASRSLLDIDQPSQVVKTCHFSTHKIRPTPVGLIWRSQNNDMRFKDFRYSSYGTLVSL